ncbi:MAG: HAMP domain-containing histidine kinase [Nitrospirae bacterium]|nr:HAMP domain-containing histidine kinase [Nitrospirota bacterium]
MIHDINNANFILLNAQIISSAWEDSIQILEKHYAENGDFTLGGLPFSEMKDNIPKLSNGIVDASRRIRDIVDNLRSMVKHDIAAEPVYFDINLAVRSAVTIMDHLIKKTTDNFRVEYADSLPHISGSPQRIAQASANLVHNALSSSNNRDAAVCISTRLDKEDGYVVIEVRDEGEGVDQSVLDHIDEPFLNKKQNPCSGLGLYVTNEIVKSNGGVLKISSAKGKGTSAEIRLPALKRQDL